MTTAILNMKKTTKTAKVKNETLLRAKTMQRAAILLKQVSDPTRLQVVTLLSEGERHVGGLCDQFNMSQPAVSHHLALLRLGGIVDRRRQGKNNFYSLTDTGYRLSKIVQRHGLLTSPRDKHRATRRIRREASGGFHSLREIRSEEAHLPATRKVKKSTPLPVTSEKFVQISDFFLHEV